MLLKNIKELNRRYINMELKISTDLQGKKILRTEQGRYFLDIYFTDGTKLSVMPDSDGSLIITTIP